MTQYIDKNKVENILRNLWKEDDGHNSEHRICYNKALQEVQCEIDTLETKEVDLDRAIDKWIDDDAITHEDCSISDVISTAKHFFELGIKSKGE